MELNGEGIEEDLEPGESGGEGLVRLVSSRRRWVEDISGPK